MLTQIKHAALALRSLGMRKGDRVALFAYPSIKWTILHFAIIVAGGVVVPIFINISPENFQFQIKQTEAKFLIIDGAHYLDIAYQNSLYEAEKSFFEVVVALNHCSLPSCLTKNLSSMGSF